MSGFIYTFIYNFAVGFVMGIIGLIIGRIIPRDLVDINKFPFKIYKWEKGGKAYNKLGINHWKDKLPDVSIYLKSVFPKRVETNQDKKDIEFFMLFAKETCVSEFVHLVLLLASPIFYVVNKNVYWGWWATILYLIGNIPFIMVQRYNRPRLLSIAKRAKDTQREHISYTDIASYR